MHKDNKSMTYDFSHLYQPEKTVDFDQFSVTVREIPHGEYAALQEGFVGQMRRTRKGTGYEVEKERISTVSFQDRTSLLGIIAWTLKTKKGDVVPVCIEAWRSLPHHVTEAIEKAIEGLNPNMDDEFPGESGNKGTDKSKSKDST